MESQEAFDMIFMNERGQCTAAAALHDCYTRFELELISDQQLKCPILVDDIHHSAG